MRVRPPAAAQLIAAHETGARAGRSRAVEHAVLEVPVALVRAHPASAMSKERTVLLRTTSFSVEAGEAAAGARPATVASDELEQRGRSTRASRQGALLDPDADWRLLSNAGILSACRAPGCLADGAVVERRGDRLLGSSGGLLSDRGDRLGTEANCRAMFESSRSLVRSRESDHGR
jgi:hypothetical protein